MGESDKVFNSNMCFVCHLTIREKKLKKCSSCRLVFYCSEDHQRVHWKSHAHLCRVIQKISLIFKPENIENNLSWYKYRTNLLMLCEMKVGRKLEPYEVNMILFPNNCQVCHKKSNLEACMNCLCVSYCSEDHKIADFASHKNICHLFDLCVQIDLHLEKTHFYPNYSLREGIFSLEDTIDKFIDSNIEIEKTNSDNALVEKALVSELLTCPLSLLFVLTLAEYTLKENLIIHVVGCSFLETTSLKSWETILHSYSQVQNVVIDFIGPEVLENLEVDLCLSCQDQLKFKFVSDFYHNYITSSCYKTPDIICSYNCGFHEFENSHTDTWNRTLPLLIQNKNVPLIFTSFTENEARRDSKLLLKINQNLNIKIVKNKFCSLRPYRDLENLGVYFNNEYISLVLSDP